MTASPSERNRYLGRTILATMEAIRATGREPDGVLIGLAQSRSMLREERFIPRERDGGDATDPARLGTVHGLPVYVVGEEAMQGAYLLVTSGDVLGNRLAIDRAASLRAAGRKVPVWTNV